jgi:hypothetical protein
MWSIKISEVLFVTLRQKDNMQLLISKSYLNWKINLVGVSKRYWSCRHALLGNISASLPPPQKRIWVTVTTTYEIATMIYHEIAQAVSRRLPTAATRVRAQVRSCRICGEQSGTRAGFLRVLRFPQPILIPPTAPHSSSSVIRGWCNRPISGRRTKWTQSHPTPRNWKTKSTIFYCNIQYDI